jgi:hypothetical protein
MESFSESVVLPSSERARRAGSSSEETFSSNEMLSVDEEWPSSSSFSSPLAYHFFDVIVDTSADSSSSSLTYLRLFSLEAIGLLHLMDSSAKWMPLLKVSAFQFNEEARRLVFERAQ